MSYMLEQIFEKLDIPQEARAIMCGIRAKHGDLNGLQELLFDETVSEKDIVQEVSKKAEELGIHRFTLALYVLLRAAEPLYEKYHEQGIDEQIFWDTIKDIKYKLDECKSVHDIWGVFVLFWYPGFYRMTRFAFGRLQFDLALYAWDTYEKDGVTVKKGDPVLDCHIPSSGKLTRELCWDSYRRAAAFSGRKVIVCDSWMLYPAQVDFLPSHSSILEFARDYDIVEQADKPDFPNSWRIFGSRHKLPPKDWPTDTSLQRAFKERIMAGLPVGDGRGVLIVDKETL